MFCRFHVQSTCLLACFYCLSINPVSASDVIEVYLLGGQSNMSGVGLIENLPAGCLPQLNVMIYHSDAVGGIPRQWIPNAPSGFSSFGVDTFGPEISLGKRLSELRPGVDIALIKHSRGGSNLAVDWNPGNAGDLFSQGVKYKEFHSTVKNGLAALQAENPGKEIQLKAMFWHQGESDAANLTFANGYQENFVNFIGRIREDLMTPDLPFIYGTIRQRTSSGVNTIIDAQLRTDESSATAFATEGAHVLDFRNLPTHKDSIDGFRDDDDTHFNGTAQIQMGKMYADKYQSIIVPEPSACALFLSGIMSLLCPRKRPH
ncbi:sialate O-acetylesterase [Bythopirellula goksoeyrii]|uniref:Sialate O-acetylesterase domain-containing protein n=1 Tax=Bythopirellula goksoeyrii TaxID=1400387 RepID=A0A5B9QQ64_9BACT|nr:sialate O-acetylesterase [Bythopirellula goksoeyrii]QEG36271.1 hypothetical protein Pr1d_35830 [Bythopirellula goksoeyrii]